MQQPLWIVTFPNYDSLEGGLLAEFFKGNEEEQARGFVVWLQAHDNIPKSAIKLLKAIVEEQCL